MLARPISPNSRQRATVDANQPVNNGYFPAARAHAGAAIGESLNAEIVYHNKFRLFVAEHLLERLLQVENPILVLGLMGSGKSTTIGVLTGADYAVDYSTGLKKFKITNASSFTPRTSEGVESQTLHVDAFPDSKKNVTYLDTAGLNEDRGTEEELWTRNNINLFFRSISKLRSIVVTIRIGILQDPRFAELKKTAAILDDVTQGGKTFYQSIIFVITGDQSLTPDMVSCMAKDIRKQYINLVIRKLEQHKHTGLGIRQTLSEAVGISQSPEDIAQRVLENLELQNILDDPNVEKLQKLLLEVNWSKASGDSNVSDVMKSTPRIMRLINELAKLDKIIISYPANPRACEALRNDFHSKLVRISSISDLAAIRRNIEDRTTINSTLFARVVISLAQSYFALLDRESELLVTVLKRCQERDLLRSIDRDWVTIRQDLLARNDNELKEKGNKIQELERDIHRLKNSTIEKDLHDCNWFIEKSSGGAPWYWGMFSGAYAKGTKTVDIPQAYSSIKYNMHHTNQKIEIKDYNFQKTQVTFSAESKRDENVSIQIRFLVYEKNLPITQQTIADKENIIMAVEADIVQLKVAKQELTNVASADALRAIILKDEAEKIAELKKIREELNAPIQNGRRSINGQEHITQNRDVIDGLNRLLQLMQECKLNAYCEEQKDTIDKFIKVCQLVKVQGEQLSTLYPNLLGDLHNVPAPVRLDVVAPVAPNIVIHQYRQLKIQLPYLLMIINRVIGRLSLSNHLFESFIFIALFGYLTSSMLLTALGTVLVIGYVRTVATNAVKSYSNLLSLKLDDIQERTIRELGINNADMREAIIVALHTLVNNIRVNMQELVNVNVGWNTRR